MLTTGFRCSDKHPLVSHYCCRTRLFAVGKKNLHRQNMPKSIEYYHNIIFTSCTETALIGCWLSRLPVRLNGTKAFYG